MQPVQKLAEKIIELLQREGATRDQAADALGIARIMNPHEKWKKD